MAGEDGDFEARVVEDSKKTPAREGSCGGRGVKRDMGRY